MSSAFTLCVFPGITSFDRHQGPKVVMSIVSYVRVHKDNMHPIFTALLSVQNEVQKKT